MVAPGPGHVSTPDIAPAGSRGKALHDSSGPGPDQEVGLVVTRHVAAPVPAPAGRHCRVLQGTLRL
jgi:hypothetical protein